MAVTPKKQDTLIAERLAALEAKVDGNHRELIAKLDPVIQLHETVQEHDRQISFWKGANALLGVLWVGLLALLGIHAGR